MHGLINFRENCHGLLHWDSMNRGHHIYEDIWISFIGESHHVQQEADNADHFAMAIQVQLKLITRIDSGILESSQDSKSYQQNFRVADPLLT